MYVTRFRRSILVLGLLYGIASHNHLNASAIVLPKPVTYTILFEALKSEAEDSQTTFELATQFAREFPSKELHNALISFLYELYEKAGATKLLIACELSGEPLINHWIFRCITLDQAKKSCRWVPRYEHFTEEVNTPSFNSTPLIAAIASCAQRTTKHLFKHGALSTVVTSHKVSPLMQAAVCEDEALLRFVLEHARQILNEADEDGYTAVHWATQYGMHKAFEMLLEAGADQSIATKKWRYTALHMAVSIVDPEMVTILLAHNPSLNALTYVHMTPLVMALYLMGDITKKTYLEEHPEVTEEDYNARTIKIMKLVLEQEKVPVTVPSRYNEMPLAIAKSLELTSIVPIIQQKLDKQTSGQSLVESY